MCMPNFNPFPHCGRDKCTIFGLDGDPETLRFGAQKIVQVKKRNLELKYLCFVHIMVTTVSVL